MIDDGILEVKTDSIVEGGAEDVIADGWERLGGR